MSVILKRTKIYGYSKAVYGTAILALGFVYLIDIFADLANQWYWLFIAAVIANTVEDTFAHRICSHNMFRVDVNSITYKILVYLQSALQGFGPTVLLVIWHRAHHMYADQGKKDPQNIREFWFRDAGALPYYIFGSGAQHDNARDLVDRSLRISSHIIMDPWTRFCEKYDLIISFCTLAVLYFVSPILFKLMLITRIASSFSVLLAGTSHLKLPTSYRNFDTKDNSYNNLLLHYLAFGLFPGVLQNNHHGMPRAMNLSYKWWEVDYAVPIIYLLKFLMEDKRTAPVNED